MNLYYRLFRRVPSDVRENKEDFLTEALCDFLIRLPEPQTTKFVNTVLLRRAGNVPWRAEFKAVLENEPLVWMTQHTLLSQDERVNRKRPDLVLFAGGSPILVVEAKVDAEAYDEQLYAYQAWLIEQAGAPPRPTAVVLLLDQGTLPPCIQRPHETMPELPQIGHTRWSEVREWLLDLPTASDRPELWFELGQELASFLIDIGVGMSSAVRTPANLVDVPLARDFFMIWPRLSALLDTVNEGTSEIRSIIAPSQTPTRTRIDEKRNLIWNWVWLTVPPATKIYAGWGFYFPIKGDYWYSLPGPQPEGSQFFVSIESDVDLRKPLAFFKSHKLPTGWILWPGKGLVKTCPIQGDALHGIDLSDHLTNWTVASLKEIWPMVQQLAAFFPQAK